MGDLRGKHLHLDCFAGIAGDMFLGAMIDLGVPEAVIRAGLERLDLPAGSFELQVGRAMRMGIDGCDVRVKVADGIAWPGELTDDDHHADAGGPAQQQHHHHQHQHQHQQHHHHRRWRSIRALIEASRLAPGVRARALDIFGRVAQAEGKLHGVDPEEVRFHEVGAMDSIVDIVGAALALDHLAPAIVTSRPVPLGHGTVRCAHGTLPVPAPAALEILAAEGAQVEDGGADRELCTPTGAAIIASCVDSFQPIPAAGLVAVGYGAGDIELDDRPNHLRAILLDVAPRDEAEREAIVVEANVDNMPPEWCEHLMARLFGAGARDVWYSPIVMKKGRPALTISALCPAGALNAVGDALLAESSTIGYRYYRAGRRVLARRTVEVETRYGALVIKQAFDGPTLVNASPEYEVCRAAAERHGVPLKEVYAAAVAAARHLAESDGSG